MDAGEESKGTPGHMVQRILETGRGQTLLGSRDSRKELDPYPKNTEEHSKFFK